MPQKALVVTTDPGGARTPSLGALDEHLRAGWRVVHATPMGGAADGFAALVVVERAAETEAEALLEQIEEEIDTDDEIQDPLLRRIVEDE
ncbi:hypothetical protein [Rubrivirga sp. IMCC43871]|uniref:hypothetical protein n=1 Tax=Rubrivirga sp. IMCC43871 TaxID=3391575 RepID=UPI00398F907D